jgi:hypothetical protein
MSAKEVDALIAEYDQKLQSLGMARLGRDALIVAAELPPRGQMLLFTRGWWHWRQRWRLHSALRKVRDIDRIRALRLEHLLLERYHLLTQLNMLGQAKRLLSYWRLAHVPLGVVLFTLAFVHVAAALYYATMLK